MSKFSDWLFDRSYPSYMAIVFGLIIPPLAILAIAQAVVSSHFEAEAFNRLTGSSVTTWDAVWGELRVDVPVREKE